MGTALHDLAATPLSLDCSAVIQRASLRKWTLVCSTLVVLLAFALASAGGASLGRAFFICFMIRKCTILQLLCVP